MTPISRTLNVMAFEFRNGILKKETIILFYFILFYKIRHTLE